MKRDMGLVRDLLLKIAEADGPVRFDRLIEGPEQRALAVYHMQMLIEEAGFVRGLNVSDLQGRNWASLELTWHGHDFLDSVRDPTVWERTQEGAKKLGGASLDVLVGIAKAYVKAEAQKRLGIDL